MAKEKPSKSRTKDQKSIKSFFAPPKKKTAPKVDKEDVAMDDSEAAGKRVDDKGEEDTDYAPKDEDEASADGEAAEDDSDVEHPSSDVDMDVPKKLKKASGKSNAPDASTLPPIHDIPAIFSDLVGRIPKIKDVAEKVQGRKLRVATMCSGTESPLLALELIQQSISEHYGVNLEIQHVFSCEIEPFKQAYIERNFQPPLLFRDVCELGDTEAHTAYGALAPVPGDVDLLVAGTSCVDYSNLNNEKQDIDANGESGRTFRGMMSWVKNHRPPIVILENVCSAPWPRVKVYFEKNGYSAEFARVDTKQYYIPHTRTRVYLVAVNEKKSPLPAAWKQWVTSKLQRPASSTLDAFLLPTDDPRIHQARQKLVQESYGALDRKTGRTDWTRCESRHQRARLEEELGSKRPLTSWDEGGFCKLPDFAWNDWGVGQVERVWDLMDISLLRAATKGIDPSYKTQVWNLSQNVDRTIGSGKVGICPCLTPSMIPYITNRGGPMVGLEALSMQGLPVDKLLLTRESEDQLADLAGNAMSTTVVGACILAALVVGQNLLKAGNDEATYESKRGGLISKDEQDVEKMDVDDPVLPAPSSLSNVVGEDQLIQKVLDLSVTHTCSFNELLTDAQKSSRLCSCEGRVGMTNRELFRCMDCGNSSCKKCGGRPEHNPIAIDTMTELRMHPSDFAKKVKATLPMCISLSEIDQTFLDTLRDGENVNVPSTRWSSWSAAVLRAIGSELRFVELKRQEIWSAVYQSPFGSLELSLHPQQPEWRLYAYPEASEPANAEIRQILASPVGRFTCSGDILSGHWDFAMPEPTSIQVAIQGVGSLVPSWEARIGLIGENFKNKLVSSEIKVTVPTNEVSKFDRDISGVYTLLDKCGTANGALHKKAPANDEADLPPLFMLFDPHRTNDSEDCFVFSISTRRLEYGESRSIIGKLASSWRQSSKTDEQAVMCNIPFRWIRSDEVKLRASLGQDARFAIPRQVLDVPVSNDACSDAYSLLVCSVPLRGQVGAEWPRGVWREVDKVHERSTFRSLAWLLERIRHVDDNFRSWQKIQLPEDHSNCERCAPTAPLLRWTLMNKKVVPVEDTIQAGEYERRLKRRPSPFVTQLKLDDDGTGTVRVAINIPSLLHRALSRLPSKNRTESPSVSWRLDTNFTPLANANLAKFIISSNKQDKKHAQPPSFKIPLRKEQLRSLEWMLAQESKDARPFIEEEISEAILDPLGWRAEGRAERPVRVRGGVLADQVGYGKTAITLGLIDCASQSVNEEFAKMGRIPGKISVKATLIIVPPHLTRQWKSEVEKFMKKRFKVVLIGTVTNLNTTTIEDIQEADIVVVASNIFKSGVYLENLQLLAGAGDLPTREGRHFNAHLEKSLEALKSQVDLLQDDGSSAVMKQIKEAQKRAADEAEAAALAQSKRLKGKAYRDAAEKIEPKADSGSSSVKMSATQVTSAKTASVKTLPAGSAANIPARAQATPSGLIPEVIITVPAGHPSLRNDNAKATEEGDTSSSGVPRKRKRRAAAKHAVIIESDDDAGSASDKESQSKAKKTAKNVTSKSSLRKKRKLSAGSSASSDYEQSSEEDSESDADLPPPTSDDEESVISERQFKPKPKPKMKAKAGKKSQASSSNDDTDAMDIGESAAEGKKTPAKKRKAADDAARPAKKAKRTESDPWKLESKAVQKDWTRMQAPPFEMFHFARKVVDEYTYLDGKVHSLVTSITAERHWVLSGTPPIHDFAALKTIAAFLNIHLGVDDDGEGQSAEVKKRRREQTAVERFHSFREVHSLEWHAHRHQLGQTFLDQFVRQNIAEIDEIPWTEKIEEITLPAAERAIYLELEHHLRALDMTIKRGKKTESDREKRLAQSLGESKTAEEALLKRCSHFDLETSKNENAMKACDVIVEERQKQLDECKDELLKAIKDGLKREKSLGNTGQESMFNEYIRVSRTEGVDDQEATAVVNKLLDDAGAGEVKAKQKSQDMQVSEKVKAAAWEHREKTHEIRRLTKELVGRVRSLRYFTVVRDLQKEREKPLVVSCPSCGNQNVPISEVAVLSSCGHTGCLTCVRLCAEKEECVYAASGACKSSARVLNVVKGDTLGVDDEARDGRGRHFGMKLEKVVNLIKKQLPKDERVLVFVQFPDLMKKVAEALTYHKVDYLEIKGTAHQKSKNLEEFQNSSKERVLLLNVMDESASGANLTCANHAIFLSPLLAQSREIYVACETQAIGRLVRYGQEKHVNIWRFMTMNTIDEDIYEQAKKATPV
ncbi:hypothetical protein BDQ12DRAFT_513516 [Crucibulum laeve]|uniref:Helicase C-terminal domain-containing protein n=1 Tax=Crucibulum laeve TaxID=68775 RepID=A0A5C3M351_9AGAR|nr:hypothetical protein BDQ12DRAFT_513516 [Crucibulum laeve]